jgi:nitroreductase
MPGGRRRDSGDEGGLLMPHLNLTVDDVLSTTRSVRKRLDLARPVEQEVIAECVALAQQAPSGGFFEQVRFVVVTEPRLRAGLADLYRQVCDEFLTPAKRRQLTERDDPRYTEVARRFLQSGEYLAERLRDVPVHVIPCLVERVGEGPAWDIAAGWADMLMPAWSFMLAARERGLGTCWTTLHLAQEREAADLLGIPFDEVMQAGLIPLAYTIGTSFKSALRKPVESILHWERR